jgi:hypothetical protein
VRRKRRSRKAPVKAKDFSVDDVNPLTLGRRLRVTADGFFKQLTSLTTLGRSPSIDESKYDAVYDADLLSGKGLHSLTSELNLRTLGTHGSR